MSKTKSISLRNFKAIGAKEIDFKGCTAIITGGNNKGKSSLLRGITDRIRGEKPDLIVKQGEKEGKGTIELTTGEKFIWEFDVEGTDKLTFITKDGYETKVTKEISARFFPVSFDIDKFLNSPPKKQSEQLQKIVGIDFSEIDNRYRLAYEDRTEKNREAERFHVKLASMLEVPKVDSVDLTELQAAKETERTRLNTLYLSNKKTNDGLRSDYQTKIDAEKLSILNFNNEQIKLADNILNANTFLESLIKLGYEGKEVGEFILKMERPKDAKVFDEGKLAQPKYIVPELPDDKELQAIDAKILTASQTNTEAKAYTDYVTYKASVEAAKVEAKEADDKVIAIVAEREKLIKSANMPAGISFSEEGITIDGFPLDKNQISTSKLYCAALRIASMNIGEVRTLHFDASFLDKNTLKEIEDWANENDLQLLIERADFEAGEINYQLIES